MSDESKVSVLNADRSFLQCDQRNFLQSRADRLGWPADSGVRHLNRIVSCVFVFRATMSSVAYEAQV